MRSRDAGFLLLIFAEVGCATSTRSIANGSKISDSAAKVRVVSHRPNRERYRFVGHVVGTVRTTEFLEVARDALPSLKERTAEVGGTLVYIDHIRVPSEWPKVTGFPIVYLSGSAYRLRLRQGRLLE